MSTTAGQKILMGCGLAALLGVGSVVLMIGGCVGWLMKDLPPWAQASVVNPANKDVTDRINDIIAHSDNLGQAQAKIGAETWPPKVLYIAFKVKEPGAFNSNKEAFKRGSWSGGSQRSLNGNGVGSFTDSSGTREFAIIEREQDTGSGVTLDYVVYIEHLPGAP